MTGSTIDLPDGPRSRAYLALVAAMKEYGPLRGAVKEWGVWDGGGIDRQPLVAPMMPYVGLSPASLPNDVMGEGRSLINLQVDIEIAVTGLEARPFLNLWDAIEDALVRDRDWRGKDLLCSFKEQGGIFQHRVVSPGLDAFRTANEQSVDFLYGVGAVVLKISRKS